MLQVNRPGFVGGYDPPGNMAASPDGEHLYLSTPSHGILTFARNPAGDHEAGDPDLVIESISMSNDNPRPGASVILRVVVRNDRDVGVTPVSDRARRA